MVGERRGSLVGECQKERVLWQLRVREPSRSQRRARRCMLKKTKRASEKWQKKKAERASHRGDSQSCPAALFTAAEGLEPRNFSCRLVKFKLADSPP